MTPFDQMKYHPTSEKLVKVLCDKTQVDDPQYFRVLVGYYMCIVAAQMHCSIATLDRGEIPINMYALSLAPSGYGKTLASTLMEEEVLHLFRYRFMNEAFPLLADDALPIIANKRAHRNQSDPDQELVRVMREFHSSGPLLFTFDSGTGPAVKQLRHKLLMADAGALNLTMDEVGANLSANKDVFDIFVELFDKGMVKQKLIKNTADSSRSEEIIGKVPTNLMMFGVPDTLLDGARIEEELMDMLNMGYARRCFFGYGSDGDKKSTNTPEQVFARRTDQTNETVKQEIAEKLENLADIINANKRLAISKDTTLKLIEYQLDCEARANKLPAHMARQKSELANRNFKVLKLAGAYAFIDDSPEVTQSHIESAIKLAEDSGQAFDSILARDKPWVKFAKYVAAVGKDITQADLAEELPFYKGSTSYKNDLMMLAIAYGYKNNIIIKKKFEDGIEFLRGETLKENDLSNVALSYSADIATDYLNERVPFDQMHRLTQSQGLHWVNHHLVGGHRNEENAIPGFGLVVLDVEGSVSISTAKILLANYRYLLHTTKRHTPEENRFRIVLPINYELTLDARDYKEFMNNIYEWLPFDVDTATNQRARKWLCHDGHFEYGDGEILDALPFIPKTSKNEARKELLNTQQSMDNLERWVINNIGDGNRNNMLLRYAMILVDGGFDFEGVRQRVMSLNNKIADKLEEVEVMSTVMITVGKAIATRP